MLVGSIHELVVGFTFGYPCAEHGKEATCGRVTELTRRPSSAIPRKHLPSQTQPEKTGIIQYDSPSIMLSMVSGGSAEG